jgi:hypothetical protein
MPTYHNLGESQQNYNNQFRNSESGGGFSISYMHEQACVYSNTLTSIKRKRCVGCCWLKAVDKETIRLATKDKKPQYWAGSNWPNIKEKRRVQELLNQHGELGTRTGKKLGRKWYVRVDLDLLWLPESLRQNLEQGFIMMMKRRGVVFIKTKKGYHVILLLDKLPSNGSIYNVDKFGVKRKIGDILSAGRQAQDLGSPEKEQPTDKGKWFWQAESIQKVSEIFEKYFLLIECKEKVQQLHADFADCSINTSQEQKISQINKENTKENYLISQRKEVSQKVYIKLAQILKWELFQGRTKREKPLYKLWYQQKDRTPRYFLLDTYQKHRELVLDKLPTGSVNNFILNQGQVYQFFYGFG